MLEMLAKRFPPARDPRATGTLIAVHVHSCMQESVNALILPLSTTYARTARVHRYSTHTVRGV